MQAFYRKALLAFILIVLADALLAAILVERSYLAAPILPALDSRAGGTVRWTHGFNADGYRADSSHIHVDDAAHDRLRFDYTLSPSIPDPVVSAELVAQDSKGWQGLVDVSQYSTISFVARCAPAGSLVLLVSIFDEQVSTPGQFLSYVPAMTDFSCNEGGVPVTLDLRRLTIPEWWLRTFKLDLSRQDYQLRHVARLVFGTSSSSARGVHAQVEIGALTLRGRDYRCLGWLAGIVTAGWIAFAIWFFRTHSRAMIAGLDAKLKKDLPLVAYRQLTLEPHRDREKAAVLSFIASNYTDPQLDLDGVVAATGANRKKVNDLLKSELGMTFSTYLNQLRVTEAARLLTEHPAMIVAEIAYAVGYANVSYFNKLFKEVYGCTPKSFRTLAQQPQPADPAHEAEQP